MRAEASYYVMIQPYIDMVVRTKALYGRPYFVVSNGVVVEWGDHMDEEPRRLIAQLEKMVVHCRELAFEQHNKMFPVL